MSAREKGPRELARIVALLIDEATGEFYPGEALREAIRALLAFDPMVEVHLLREHEQQAYEWMNLNDWRPTCLPRPELAEAYQEWMGGLVYVDRRGTYHYKGEKRSPTGGRRFGAPTLPRRQIKTPWSDRARRYHPSNESFAEAARRWQVEREEAA